MALIYNGKTLNPSAVIKYAGVDLQKIIYKNVTVWQKYLSGYVNYSKGRAQVNQYDGYVNFPKFEHAYSLSNSNICLKVNSDNTITALCSCKVVVTMSFHAYWVDGVMPSAYVYITKNGSRIYTAYSSTGIDKAGVNIIYTSPSVSLSANDKIGVQVYGSYGGNSSVVGARANFVFNGDGYLKYTATVV